MGRHQGARARHRVVEVCGHGHDCSRGVGGDDGAEGVEADARVLVVPHVRVRARVRVWVSVSVSVSVRVRVRVSVRVRVRVSPRGATC